MVARTSRRRAFLFFPSIVEGRQWFVSSWPPPDDVKIPIERSLRRLREVPVVEESDEVVDWVVREVYIALDIAVYQIKGGKE